MLPTKSRIAAIRARSAGDDLALPGGGNARAANDACERRAAAGRRNVAEAPDGGDKERRPNALDGGDKERRPNGDVTIGTPKMALVLPVSSRLMRRARIWRATCFSVASASTRASSAAASASYVANCA